MNIISIKYRSEDKPQINPEAFDAVLKTSTVHSVDEFTAETVYEFETPVTQIGANAFSDDLYIRTITLPDSVVSIHPEAFYFVEEMESHLVSNKMLIQNGVLTHHFDKWNSEIVLPEGIVEIAPNACSFFHCKKMTLPSTLKVIGDGAFNGCNDLTSIKFPKGLEVIGNRAFRDTLLGTVTIPDTVKSVGYEAFDSCKKLKKIKFGKGVEHIGEKVVSNCRMLQTIDGKGATADKRALVLNHTLLAYTLKDASMEMEVEEGVTRIGDSAFERAENLQKVTLPSTLESIGSDAFAYSGVVEMEIPERVHTISPGAFTCANIRQFRGKFASDNHSMLIDGNRLLACKTAPDDGTSGPYELTIPENVTVIEARACERNKWIGKVVWHDQIVSIGDKAFFDCRNIELPMRLPDNLTSIGSEVFLTVSWGNFSSHFQDGVIIPANVKEIGSFAFGNLDNCWLEAETPTVADLDAVVRQPFSSLININIYVPAASVATYQKAYPTLAEYISAWER